MTASTAIETAAALGISVSTLRRWVADGAPVARMGRRGRACAALYDVRAVRAWRNANDTEAALLAFAGEVPQLVAAAVEHAFNETELEFDKRRIAGVFAGVWYVVAAALLDRLRHDVGGVPELSCIPAAIERLRKIASK